MPNTTPTDLIQRVEDGVRGWFNKEDLSVGEVETEPYSETEWDSVSDWPEDCEEYGG